MSDWYQYDADAILYLRDVPPMSVSFVADGTWQWVWYGGNDPDEIVDSGEGFTSETLAMAAADIAVKEAM